MKIIPFSFLCSVMMAGSTALLGENETPALMGDAASRSIEASDQEDKKIDEQATQFISQHETLFEGGDNSPPVAGAKNTPAELVVPQGVNDMVIDAEGGFYMDMTKEGVIIYYKNIKTRHPKLSLDCDKELKIYLEPMTEEKKQKKRDEAEKKKQKTGEKSSSAGMEGFTDDVNFEGEMRKIVALGNVIAKGESKDGKKKYEARGEQIVINAKTKEILLTGGNPMFKDDKMSIQCIEPGGTIRRTDDGKIFVKGRIRSIARDLDTDDFGKDKDKKKP